MHSEPDHGVAQPRQALCDQTRLGAFLVAPMEGKSLILTSLVHPKSITAKTVRNAEQWIPYR